MGAVPEFIVYPADRGALMAPQYVDHRLLVTAGTAETVTVPANGDIVVFQLQDDEGIFYARWDGSAAAVPSGDIADGTGAEINPSVRFIPNSASTSFSIVSPIANTLVIMSFYSCNSQPVNRH